MVVQRRKLLIVSSIVLAVFYVSGPIIAAIFEIGNRRGPKIYPSALHEAIYMLTWELTPHRDNKPRIAAVFRSEYRPWFYGMYSQNDDPVWLMAEYRKLEQRLAAEQAADK